MRRISILLIVALVSAVFASAARAAAPVAFGGAANLSAGDVLGSLTDIASLIATLEARSAAAESDADIAAKDSLLSQEYQIRGQLAALKNSILQSQLATAPSSSAQPSPTAALPASVSISSPAAGGAWRSGSTYVVGWTSRGMATSTVGIVLKDATDDETMAVISNPVLPSSGSYSWTVPTSMPSGKYYVLVYGGPVYGSNYAKSGIFTVSTPTSAPDYVKPVISSVNPQVGAWNTVITIHGQNFATTATNEVDVSAEGGNSGIQKFLASPDGMTLAFSIGSYAPGTYMISVSRQLSSNQVPFTLVVPTPNFSVIGGGSALLRNASYTFQANVAGAIPNAPVLFYLERPDGSMKYGGFQIGATDAQGNFSLTQSQVIGPNGENGRWTAWVTVGGAASNRAVYSVSGGPISQAETLRWLANILPELEGILRRLFR